MTTEGEGIAAGTAQRGATDKSQSLPFFFDSSDTHLLTLSGLPFWMTWRKTRVANKSNVCTTATTTERVTVLLT